MNKPIFPLWPHLSQWATHSVWRSLCLFGPFIVIFFAAISALISLDNYRPETALVGAVIGIGIAICAVAAIYYSRAARTGQYGKPSSISRICLALLIGIPLPVAILLLF